MKGIAKPAIDRRTFLKNAAAAGGAAAVFSVSRKVPATQDAESSTDSKTRNKGYQDTRHTRTYYKTARL